MSHTETFTTARTLPAPWAECELCSGPTPALPDLDGLPRCPECAALTRLHDAALEHLGQLLAPDLGAWAHHYAAQGMTPAQLHAALELYTGGDLNHPAQREHLNALLAQVMAPTPPTFTPAPPDRVQLDARTLPQLLAAHLDPAQNPSDGAGQIDRRLSFTGLDRDGRQVGHLPLSPGRAASLLLNTNAAHDALLYFTDLGGPTAYRVPAHLLPQVRAALGYWGSAAGAP